MAAWSSGLHQTHGDVTLANMGERIVTIDPDVMGGTPVFAGTRVPVRTFLDYLDGGETIDHFLEGFPSVSREQVIAFLEAASRQIVAAAS